jgi:hypothetical protein
MVDYGQLTCGIMLMLLFFLLLFGMWKMHKWQEKQPKHPPQEEEGIPPILGWLIFLDWMEHDKH